MRTRMRRGIAAALTVSALCFTAAACGGGDDEKKPAAADKAKGDDKAKSEEKPVTKLTAAQMKAATLEVKDLPTGWKSNKLSTDNSPAPKADKPECQPLANMMAGKIKGATMGGDTEFENKSGGSELSHQVVTFDGTGAADFTKGVGTALDSCSSVSFTQDGEKVDLKIEKLSAPKVGEDSHSFTMTMSMPELGVDFKVNLMVASQGTGATRLAYIAAPGGKVTNAFDDLVKRAGDKFVKGAQS
jgi:hypothetical protein